METKYVLLRTDYWLQTIMGIMIIVFGISIIGITFGLLLAMPFGAWQVISALIFGITNQDKRRFYYLACVGLYFSALYFTNGIEGFRDLGFIFYAVIAAILGVWYYILTRKDFKNFNPKAYLDERNDNILDA